MTKGEKIALLKAMIDDQNVSDDVLSAYLTLAGDKILNRMYPFKENYDGLSVPDRYVSVQLNVAAYMLNKRGAEGQIQHIENGIHRNYGSADIPKEMIEDVVPYCQVIR